MSKLVREPIQVYLTPQERAALDQAARAMGVSRSEALRRGISAMRETGHAGVLRDLAHDGYVTPPAVGPGEPPPSAPVAPLEDLLADLAEDRADR
jgi:hypothetical protein